MQWLRAAAVLLLAAVRAVASAPDELATLKAENPNAYNVVKALLAKKQMGVLDPRHPSASFATSPVDEQEPVDGRAAFEKFMPPAEPAAVAVSREAPAIAPSSARGRHKDWMTWKPRSEDEDTEVSSVLDSVEELTGKPVSGSSRKHLRSVQEQKETAAVVGGAPSPAKGIDAPGSLSASLDWLQAPAFTGSSPAPVRSASAKPRAGNAYLSDLGLEDFSATSLAAAAARQAKEAPVAEPRRPPTPQPSAKAEVNDEQSMFEAALGLGRDTSDVASVSSGQSAPAERVEKGPSTNPYLADLGATKTEEVKDLGSSKNPYLTALGLTKIRGAKADEPPASIRLREQSREKDNPYLEGLHLDLSKALSLSSVKQTVGQESAEVEDAPAKQEVHGDGPWKDKLSTWLHSKKRYAGV